MGYTFALSVFSVINERGQHVVSTSDFKNGLNIEVDGDAYRVVWFQHHKPGKGGAVMRVKLENIRSGSIVERTFKSGERFRDLSLTRLKKQYLYEDPQGYHFMDNVSYEQIQVPKEKIGKLGHYLVENMEVNALFLEEEFLNIELPASVPLKVKETVPGVKGDSVTNMMKPATLETGVEVQVPLFIKEGDTVKVDTRTGEYVERA